MEGIYKESRPGKPVVLQKWIFSTGQQPFGRKSGRRVAHLENIFFTAHGVNFPSYGQGGVEGSNTPRRESLFAIRSQDERAGMGSALSVGADVRLAARCSRTHESGRGADAGARQADSMGAAGPGA